MKSRAFLITLFTITLSYYSNSFAQVDARMLRQPDVSESHIVFSYADDIWIVSKSGGTANRLTSAKGQESFPRFSPDGTTVAYTANYDGNNDIYVIPAEGGVPVRVTHHPMNERVLGWFPDGENILFSSSMKSGRQRYNQFYKVSVDGGLPQKLPVPYGEFGDISPDGQTLAYTPKSRVFRTWKRYRGGWAPDILLFDLETYESQKVTDNDANDDQPMWHDSTLYFMSDRGKDLRYNIWAYDRNSEQTLQVTDFNEYDIHFPAIGPSDLVFEAGGRLYLMDLETEQTREVEVDVITDKTTLKPHTENVSNLIQNAYLSPDGNRVLFQARGDLFSVPNEHGPIMNLTRSSGVAERYPAWSPDGNYVAYWSDRSGEYELTVRDNRGSGSERTLTSTESKFKYNLYWSPDSKKLVFVDNAMNIRLYDMEEEALTDIGRGLWMYEGGLRDFSASWSPDSRWVAFSRGLDNRQHAIFLHNTDTGETTQVTSSYYHDRDPVFDPDGKYLYLLSSRTLDPEYSDMDNTWIYANSTNIAAVPLTDSIASPLAPRNDEVEIKKEDQESKEENENGNGKEPEEVEIDLEGFESRLVQLPPDAGNYGNISAVSGKVLYQQYPRTGAEGNGSTLKYYDLEEREEKTIIENINGYQLSADGKKVLVYSEGKFDIIDPSPEQKVEKPLRTDELTMEVVPREEWQQIFNDTWRFIRDFFYDPNLHGVDWDAMKQRYQRMLDDAVTRTDVNYVIGELIAELNASHTYRGGGDQENAEQRGGGLLGIDWALSNGAYQIENIVEGAPWDNEVRSPFHQPGIDVSEGDYILAVNGMPMDTSKDPYAAFEGLAEKTVELTVNNRPEMEGARQVLVETLSNETRLRHLSWIESNRKRVEEATDGRVGYIYVRSTGIDGQNELVRQFMAQFDKEALIIDERFNSGGQIPDRFIELLNRPELVHWAVRDGRDWQWPPVANFGPKVMLINGWSGSGGDAFPSYFRQSGLGPLIGTRTWGGLIGISGAPGLIDGGGVTVPTFRMYYPNGEWFPEGHGVEPDIHVEDDPTQLARGTDPQLERAIQEIEQMLKENPNEKPERPPYEDRTGTGN
ncbi:PDZ domain-containing protein [Aliifodinibius sp. S!AR15-10]|uniref:S41 family peptidase n=1 Tax=Aliifodinibius sp. S!AR15-10 TaxID=2950437 RepID=UPI00285CE5BA|nr:PDZ domain-containing protein [Aliifodinibius sp. S!AR15-10]MDR8390097.1 PDZ domain-containing protein [Aliifodinibius sp. S!AR15-10]